MKKQLLLFFVFSALSLSCWAGKVTVDQALRTASSFMSGKTFKIAVCSRKQVSLHRTKETPFYVFNATDGGFVVVSGDDRTREILGYSLTGSLDMDSLPANLQWWLDEYARQISALGTSTVAVNTSRVLSAASAISPLIDTKWDQGAPYNNMCPDGNGKDYYESGYDAGNRCLTGCVATAMAQVMCYWKWPKSSTALGAYIAKNFEVKSLPSTTFKWDLMKDSYGNSETGEAVDAVAELMRYCGQAAMTDYMTYQSGAYLFQEVMSGAFSYSRNMRNIYRDQYNLDEWENIIYRELAEGRPVIYNGYSTNGGHEFIVDGYDTNGLFHINWGWGGSYDDYFLLSVADPYMPSVDGNSSSGGYRYNQFALVGIKPFREGESEPYALLSEDAQTVTFYYDGHLISREGMDLGNDYQYFPDKQTYAAVTKVIIDDSFADYYPFSTEQWFNRCNNLKAIEGISNLHTDYVTNMREMFSGCSSLTSLDPSGFKTDNVTNMYSMFRNCSSLASLDLSGFKTDNVTNMSEMFSGCSSLTSLDLSGFKTDNVTEMREMFSGCSSLTSLNLSGFKTDNVTNMYSMFYNCSSLTSLDLSCFKTGSVTEMREMFSGCSSLTSLDLSGFKTDNVADMYQLFNGCTSLASLDLSGFKTDNVTNMRGMFGSCSNLKSINLSTFNTNNVTTMWDMFSGCSSLTTLDLSNFNTSNVTLMGNMFRRCSNLITIYAGVGWNTDKVENSSNMFQRCINLKGGQGTEYNSSYIDHFYARIDGGVESPGYFTYKQSADIGTMDSDNITVSGDIYDFMGLKRYHYTKGLNIIRMSDGRVRKIVVRDR